MKAHEIANKEELINALRYHADATIHDCDGCPYQPIHKTKGICLDKMISDAADALEATEKRIAELEKRTKLPDRQEFLAKGSFVEEPLSRTKEGEWIPCSERLPNGQTEVIVSCCDDAGDSKYNYTSFGWMTRDGEYWIVDNEINYCVNAWMPLPEPWKGAER